MSTQDNKFAEKRRDEVDFLSANKQKRFCKLIVSFWVCVTRNTQFTQINKFTVSLQDLEKELSDKVDILNADKHENFLQIGIMIFDGDGQAFPKFPK